MSSRLALREPVTGLRLTPCCRGSYSAGMCSSAGKSRRRWALVVAGACLGVVGCNKQRVSAAPPPPAPADFAIDQQPQQPQQPQHDDFQNRQRQRPPQQDPPSDPPPPRADEVVARVKGRDITMRQLQEPLVEGYGLPILLNLVQLELAREEARQAKVTITPDDVRAERERTLAKLFPQAEKSDYDALFEQFLQQQRVTRPEFDIVVQINAHLRKVVEPNVKGRVTDANLEEAFRQTYGETVQVRHIQVGNMTEIADVKARLAAGEPVEQVARTHSRNPRPGPLGGELPPFSRAAANYPQAFRDAAFALKPGEVSDPVQADGSFHLIKLENRIPPKAVKFEDVKESLRVDLEDRLVQAGMNQLRNQLGQEALKSLKVEHPVLRDQYQQGLESREAQVRDRDLLREQLEKNRRDREQAEALEDPAATQPATAPVTAPATTPATVPALEP